MIATPALLFKGGPAFLWASSVVKGLYEHNVIDPVLPLIVDGKPFLVRGGELGNSSGEPDYLRVFWLMLKAMNLSTVAAPVH